MWWRRPEAGAPAAALPEAADLERAARVLAVRSRREVTSAFAGGYLSAFRGGGLEFDESRPYAPGDDVRSLDWNALARTGVPYVKRFREERDQTVLLAVDVSASMAFTSARRTKAHCAAHAAALIAGAAVRAGDQVGLLAFADTVRDEVAPGRGTGHLAHLLGRLAAAGSRPAGATDLGRALVHLGRTARRRAVVVLLSDFRDDGFFLAAGSGAARGPAGGNRPAPPRIELVRLARNHDVVAGVVDDPRDAAIPGAGSVRLHDPETPGRPVVLATRSARARELYRTACAVRRRALERRLRSDGADVLWLRTDREPLQALARFFHLRAGRRPRLAS